MFSRQTDAVYEMPRFLHMNTPRAAPSRSVTLVTAIMLLIGSTTLFSADAGSLPEAPCREYGPSTRSSTARCPGSTSKPCGPRTGTGEPGVPVAPRIGKVLEVDYTLDNSGTWEVLEDGSRLWRLRISSPGALSLSLGLKRFDLPEGAMFWVHAADGSGVQGPYTKGTATPSAGCGPPSSATSWWPSCICQRVRRAISSSFRSTMATVLRRERERVSDERGRANQRRLSQGTAWRDQIRLAHSSTLDDRSVHLRVYSTARQQHGPGLHPLSAHCGALHRQEAPASTW